MSPRRQEDEVEEEEEEEAEEERQPRHRPKKPRLFGDSNLTDAERREIRQTQRDLQQKVRDGEYATLDDLGQARKTNNKIFADKVCYTREAVLDADNVDLIASQYAQQVEKQVQVPRYDPIKLVQKLVQKCTNKSSSSHYFDWKLLGAEAGICFNALPERVSFLAGALDHQVTMKKKADRKPREKAVVDDSEEVTPETVENANNKGDADKLSAMEKAMRIVGKKLEARTLEENGKNPSGSDQPDIDGVQFLINPKSFTQSVENIFNFSFLIKKGEAEVGVRPDTGALFVAKRTFDSDDMPECTQAVCSFTMADWRRLVAEHELKEGDLPHRTGTKHGRSVVDAAHGSQ